MIETERLLLREMTQEDYPPSLAAILQDEKTMYAYETPLSPPAETQAWLDRNLARYKTDGFGLWAVILKDTGTMIGQAGLTWQSIGGGHQKYWKLGICSIAATGGGKDMQLKQQEPVRSMPSAH